MAARRCFPDHRTDRRPSFSDFERLLLDEFCEELCTPGRFEGLPPAEPGSEVRVLITRQAPALPPVAIYLWLIGGDLIELVDMVCDYGYDDLIARDPD